MKSMNPTRLLVIGLLLALCGILITLRGANKSLGVVLLCAGVAVTVAGAQTGRRPPRD